MPKDTPSFSSKSIKPQKTIKKKVVRRKKTGKQKSTTDKTFKNKKREINKKENKIKEAEIDQQLNYIYQDGKGNLPNMKRIKIRKTHPVIKFLFSLIVVSGLLATVAWAGFFVMPNNNKFSEDKVSLNIQGQTKINLGVTTTYTISYNNKQNNSLKEAVLTVQYPKGFSLISSQPKASNSGQTEWDLGTISAQEKKTITITGLTYGQSNNAESWRVFLTYRPEKFNYRAQKIDTLQVELEKSPFSLAVSGPDQTTIGKDVEYIFKINNTNKQTVGKLLFSPSWNSNFFIITSTPAHDKNKKWLIDTNTSTSEWLIKVKGRYASTTDSQAITRAVLAVPMKDDNSEYELAKSEIITKLIQDNLKLNLAINGQTKDFTAQPEDTLNFTTYLKNTSKQDLSEVKVKLIIDAPSANNRSVMDWGNLKDKYDGDILGTQLSPTLRRGEITWYKKFIPNLAKLILNDEVNIDTSLPIRGMTKFDLTKLKTYEIKISAQASYKDKDGNTKTLASNPIKITLNSDLKLKIRDTKSTNKNNQEQHALKWILTNEFHELKDITVSADVYGKSSWKLDGQAPAGKVNYDTNKQKITWTIDKMPLVVDTLALPFTITINQTNPSQNILVSKVRLEATDVVTGEKITLNGEEIKLK